MISCHKTLDLLQNEAKSVLSSRRTLVLYSLSFWAVAVHAVLDGLVAGLANSPAGHLHRQTRFGAPLDASLQLPAISLHCREPNRAKMKWIQRQMKDAAARGENTNGPSVALAYHKLKSFFMANISTYLAD